MSEQLDRGRPAHLWTPRSLRRGKIHDKNAFLRMKRHVELVLDTYSVWSNHTMAKALYDDDALVIRNRNIFGLSDETVLHALENNGIQCELKRGRQPLGTEIGILWILIPVDQPACPPGRKGRPKFLD